MAARRRRIENPGPDIDVVHSIGDDETRSQTDFAADVIRESILDLSLPPGARLDDRLLFERFGIGRTPAREATNRLASEGLVEFQRNKGAFVRALDIAGIRHFFDAYAASERLNGYFCRTGEPGLVEDLTALNDEYEARVAARQWREVTRLNSAFHLRIAGSAGNQYIFDFAERLHNQTRRVSYLIHTMETDGGLDSDPHERRIRSDHRAIVEAVRRHDNGALIDLLTRHVQLFHGRIIGVLGGARGANAPLPLAFPATPVHA